jgi:hypothetical protein
MITNGLKSKVVKNKELTALAVYEPGQNGDEEGLP